MHAKWNRSTTQTWRCKAWLDKTNAVNLVLHSCKKCCFCIQNCRKWQQQYDVLSSRIILIGLSDAYQEIYTFKRFLLMWSALNVWIACMIVRSKLTCTTNTLYIINVLWCVLLLIVNCLRALQVSNFCRLLTIMPWNASSGLLLIQKHRSVVPLWNRF